MASTSAKLSRADAHIKELKSEIGKFLGRDPYRLVPQIDPQTGDYILRTAIGAHPPPKLSAIIGDAVQNFRAALDHAIYDLTLLYTGSDLKRTEFPIFDDVHDYWRKERTGRRKGLPAKASGLYKLRGIFSLPVHAFIESEQPYHGGNVNDDALWILHELSNIDKHRRLHLTGATITNQNISFSGAGHVGVFYLIHLTSGPFDHGTEVARWKSADISSSVNMQHNFSFDVTFGPSGPAAGKSVLSALDDIRSRVVGITDLLKLAF